MVVLEAESSIGWKLRDQTSGETVLFQTDYDLPVLASSLGIWSTKHSGKDNGDCLGAGYTDGTVPCPLCGRPAGWFIDGAVEALDEHEGEEFEDPGYF